ncbi:hypothetical protein NPIL_280421 [Nephila pilipes]|uniref:Uncharacterized protein n=1 Tax=Nephila pilipes TaxID=299642 RepID=A0A8X6T197_NEPPI|nr:hypothetical protein NPIL_280421 [Nephila pilipes]
MVNSKTVIFNFIVRNPQQTIDHFRGIKVPDSFSEAYLINFIRNPDPAQREKVNRTAHDRTPGNDHRRSLCSSVLALSNRETCVAMLEEQQQLRVKHSDAVLAVWDYY